MRYSPKTIEAKWQKKWLAEKTYEPDFSAAKKPYYNLMMFPYPSAEGLHVGNMYAFTGADIYGRFMRMRGYDVFEPIGLDGFGIHSENYALKIGTHPMEQARVSEKNFYRQLSTIGNGFAWRERLETYDPEYYKWTQWIFTALFKRGLAYRKKAEVNWCPSCKTVLADEQVISGKCERCGTEVVRKELEQWFFKITDYAERLLKNLEKIDWSEKVKIAQRNWIGRSEGTLIDFPLTTNHQPPTTNRFLQVFTTRPDTLFGATFMVISPELAQKWMNIGWQASGEVKKYVREALARRTGGREGEAAVEKTGVPAGIMTINPANKEEIPVWVSDYVLGNVGTGAIMAVPGHDQRDFEFAKKYNLPIVMVVCPHYPAKTCPVLDAAYEGEGHLVASGKFDGMPSEKARWEITKFVRGKRMMTYRLRDWLISRQRYWGPPIPVVFCEKCAERITNHESRITKNYTTGELENPGWIAVPEKDLPVKLPHIKNFRPTGTNQSPLASVEKFYKVRCPKCKAWARRETDVSDTFLDSAWYYVGYLMELGIWNLELGGKKFSRMARKWLPVDMYIGGAEHSVLHLLYVRFLAMALHDMKLLSFEEPFPVFRSHGLLIKDGAKMSKSRGNVVNSDEYIRAYGADALRMYLMFLGPFEQGGDFRDSGMKGITRFLERAWRFTTSKIRNPKSEIRNNFKIQNKEIQKRVHKTVKKVTEDIENLRYNTAISALMVLLNAFEEHPDAVSRQNLEIFLKLLAPFAPHISEELYQKLLPTPNSQLRTSRAFRSIHRSSWPKYNSRLIHEDTFELVVQVNGKVRGRVELPVGIGEAEAKKSSLMLEAVKKHISGEPRKVIFVPGKLINFVL